MSFEFCTITNSCDDDSDHDDDGDDDEYCAVVESINQSFYCKKAWQNAHLDKKNTVKCQWTRDNSYA